MTIRAAQIARIRRSLAPLPRHGHRCSASTSIAVRCRRALVSLRAPVQAARTRLRAARLARARAVHLSGGARARGRPEGHRARHPPRARRRGFPLPVGGTGLDGLARALHRPLGADAAAGSARADVRARRRRSPLAVRPARLDLGVTRALRCGRCADVRGSVGGFDVLPRPGVRHATAARPRRRVPVEGRRAGCVFTREEPPGLRCGARSWARVAELPAPRGAEHARAAVLPVHGRAGLRRGRLRCGRLR